MLGMIFTASANNDRYYKPRSYPSKISDQSPAGVSSQNRLIPNAINCKRPGPHRRNEGTPDNPFRRENLARADVNEPTTVEKLVNTGDLT